MSNKILSLIEKQHLSMAASWTYLCFEMEYLLLLVVARGTVSSLTHRSLMSNFSGTSSPSPRDQGSP